MTNETADDVYHSICDQRLFPYHHYTSYPDNYCNYDFDNSRPDATEEERVTYYATSVAKMMYEYLKPIFQDDGRRYLEASMFFINEAWLSLATTRDVNDYRTIYADFGLPVSKPSISRGALITVTVLLAWQILMIVLLLFYIYSSRVWTPTLDSLAIARIAHQLKDRGAIAAIGLRPTRRSDLAPLHQVDGLVGVVEHDRELDMIRSSSHHRRDSDDTLQPPPHDHDARPPPYAGDTASTAEQPNGTTTGAPPSAIAQSLQSREAEIMNDPGLNPPYALQVGGQGLITRHLARAKRDWAAVYA